MIRDCSHMPRTTIPSMTQVNIRIAYTQTATMGSSCTCTHTMYVCRCLSIPKEVPLLSCSTVSTKNIPLPSPRVAGLAIQIGRLGSSRFALIEVFFLHPAPKNKERKKRGGEGHQWHSAAQHSKNKGAHYTWHCLINHHRIRMT